MISDGTDSSSEHAHEQKINERIITIDTSFAFIVATSFALSGNASIAYELTFIQKKIVTNKSRKNMNQREILVRKIRQVKADLKTAGIIHRRDLQKHIRRIECELRDYDRFHTQTHLKADSA